MATDDRYDNGNGAGDNGPGSQEPGRGDLLSGPRPGAPPPPPNPDGPGATGPPPPPEPPRPGQSDDQFGVSQGLLDSPLPKGGDASAGIGDRDLLSQEGLQKQRAAAMAAAGQAETDPDRIADEADGKSRAMEEGAAAAAQPPFSGAPDGGGERREKGDDRRSEPREGDDRRGDGPDWQVRPSPGTKDDPLLGCLTVLCTLLDRNISAEALTAGLPLVDGIVTPELFIRSAERAGISSRLLQRSLESINRLALPCVLLLNHQRACVLTDIRHDERTATIIMPEMGTGSRNVDYDELAREYVGYALFARPEFQYDARAVDTKIADPKGWFWGTIFTSWKLYVEVMIAATMINCFAIANPMFVMNVYDRVVPNFAQETLWVLAIGILIVYSFDFILKLLRGYLIDVAGKSADTRIASRLFQQMLGMKMSERPPSTGGLANSLREFEHLREFFTSSTITSLVDFPFIFLFLAIIAVIGTWQIVVIPAFIVFVVIIVGLLVQIKMQEVVRETFREAQQKHAILIETISGIETIKATGSEGRMQRAWETFVGKTAVSAMKATRYSQFAMNFSGVMMQVVTVAVVIVGVYQIQEGNMTVGALVACTLLSGRALAPLGQIAGIATRFNQARQSLQALDQMMRTPVERPEGKSFVHRPNFAGNVEFKNVKFTYPGAETLALNDVSFSIQAGEKVGIIGRIGSGKSTIERLVLGLYEPGEGAVLIDGTDTRQVDPADLRRSIGVVPQDNYLFFGTVKENIALGAVYADDSSILRAARIAGVDEFTSKHPQGLDMPVGERGASLSGGQRQAITVARALLLDPPVLLMDEPTSSMDNTTEGRFKARLNTVLASKTLLLVTHRGSLLSLVDRLIVMDGGRIVADGPKDIVMDALSTGRIHTART